MVLAGRLPPAAMFPAGRSELRTRHLWLASGLRVRVVECGSESAQTIVLLPGWACSAYVFRENLAPLAAAGFRAIAVDLKGHGLSDKPQAPVEYRLEAMRQHVIEILDAVGGERLMIGGLSMGAALAAHAATADPGRIRAVVMGSPVGFSGLRGLPALRLLTPSPLTPLLPRLASRAVIERLLRFANGKLRQITERDVDEYWAPTQFPEFTRAMRHLLNEFTWRAPFTPLPVPCLLISGTRDRFVTPPSAEAYRRGLSEVRHLEVRDAGHVVYDEASSVVNETMIDFFRSVAR